MGFIPLAENHLYQFEFELLATISALILIKRCQGEQRLVNVRFGSKADICSAKSHVRFTPKSGLMRCSKSTSAAVVGIGEFSPAVVAAKRFRHIVITARRPAFKG
jgi:hypothetical protein